jgi:hypothetical protein
MLKMQAPYYVRWGAFFLASYDNIVVGAPAEHSAMKLGGTGVQAEPSVRKLDVEKGENYAGYVVVSPLTLELQENHTWTFAQATFLFLPVFAGVPFASFSCNVRLDGDLVRRDPIAVLKTYHGQGAGWAANAMYLGYDSRDVGVEACSRAC